jgi:MHS family shikimate/dehydroshikimate transporter-like MFS transporter
VTTSSLSPSQPAVRSRALSPLQVAFAAMIGTAVELYDFILYSFIAATVFGPLFFPMATPWLGTLAALSGHAVAFLVRPLGAVLFGRIGDRLGRRPALVLSLSLMGAATVGVGLLPTYATIGLAAPVLLVVLRLVQGLAIGGEYPGAVVVAAEHAPEGRRTFYGGFAQIGIMVGILLAAVSLLLVSTVVGTREFAESGWRLPFLFSALLVIVGLVLRRRLAESPEFVDASARIAAQHSAPGRLRTLFRDARRPLIACTLLWIGPVTYGYAFLTSLLAYTKTYVPGLSAVTVQTGLVLTAAALVVFATTSARFGARLGRERVAIAAGIWTILWAAPSFWLIGQATPATLWSAMIVGGFSYGIFSGVAPSLMSEAFPVSVRYLGVAVCIAVSALIGGALLPLPTLAIVGATGGSPMPMAVMMMISGAATVTGGVLLRRAAV